MKKALLVIDVQSYFLAKSPKDLPQKIAQYINAENYDLVFFTKFRNLPNSNWEKSLGWLKCREDEDLVLPKEFDGLAEESNTFEKHTYSALNPGNAILKELSAAGVQEVDICGIDTEACVLATAYDAFDHGFNTKVILNLCHSRPSLDEQARSIILRTIQHENA